MGLEVAQTMMSWHDEPVDGVVLLLLLLAVHVQEMKIQLQIGKCCYLTILRCPPVFLD